MPLCSHASKRPSRGLQEALKSQNLRMVLTVSSFLEWTIFGIRYSGFCTFGSKTRVSGLKTLAFHICLKMVSAHGQVGLFGRTSEAAFLCLILVLLPPAVHLQAEDAGDAKLHPKSLKIIALGGKK